MNRCSCGRSIGQFDKYCDWCEKGLTLREKVLERLRHDEIFGSQILKRTSSKGFDTSDPDRWRDN